jgi:uncharacterized membrane protein
MGDASETENAPILTVRLSPHRSLDPKGVRLLMVVSFVVSAVFSLPFYFELLFARVSARGARREWRFNPAWVRVERVDHEEFGPQRLSLLSRGRRWEIARFLGPDQKAEFAATLSQALAEARRGPRFG